MVNSSVVVHDRTIADPTSTAVKFPLSGMWMRLCQMESPVHGRVWIFCQADVARVCELVYHIV